jgi:acid phosphatase family membrane protein YuiD
MGLIRNTLIISALFAMIVAQIAKVIILLLTEGRWAPKRATETGGMPSSHTATVAALATSSALEFGVSGPEFAVALVLGIIVIYDATGIRRAAGKHAEILNELVEEFGHLFEEKRRPKALKTLLGHTYPQVFVGSGLGIAVGFIVHALPWFR